MGEFRYYAFVSYSHRDKDFVEKLHRRLEEYKIPNAIRKRQIGIPSKVRPIFRDKTDLTTTSSLQNELFKELEQSRFLIVVCSPNSAQVKDNKHWVNMEVEYFKSLGRGDNIIPVIIQGEPNSKDPEQECYCPALRNAERQDEYLGVDAHGWDKAKGKKLQRVLGIPDDGDVQERAIAQIVARMFGLRFDDLWQRERKLRLRQGYVRLAAIASTLLVLVAGGLIIWNKEFRVTHKYYLDYVDRWGLPEGVFELSKQELAGRSQFYTFSYRGGKLREIRLGNGEPSTSVDDLVIDPMKFSHGFFSYDENGSLVETRVRDAKRTSTSTRIYQHRPDLQYCRVNIIVFGREAASLDFDLSDAFSGGTNITSFSMERDANGYVTRYLFHKYHNAPVPATDTLGAVGYEYLLDSWGRIRERYVLGLDDKGAVYRRQLLPDDIVRIEYDESGNMMSVSRVDGEGNLFARNSEWARIGWEYDGQGNKTRRENYGVDGQLTLDSYGVAIYEWEYDSAGNQTRQEHYGVDGQLTLHSGGFAILENEYDGAGNQTRRENYGVDGQLTLDNDGVAIYEWEYDSAGNVTRSATYGVDGQLTLHSYGVAILESEYDGAGNIIRQECYGADGQLTLDSNGVAIYELEYDSAGNQTRQKHYGIDGQLTLGSYGVAIVEWEYDGAGNVTRSATYGVDGQLTLDSNGVAIYEWEYDSAGNVVETRLYDAQGRLIE